MIEHYILQFSEAHRLLTYLGVFFGMFIEGEMILILSGILIKSGAIGFLNTLLIAFAAVILHDAGYLYIGKKLSELKKKKYLFFDLEKAHSLFKKIERKQGLYVLFSKFAWNLNRIVLVSLGYLKVPFKKIYRMSIIAAFLWSLTFISLGFIFAEQTDIIKRDLKFAAISITIFVLVIFGAENLFQKYFRSGNNKDKSELGD